MKITIKIKKLMFSFYQRIMACEKVYTVTWFGKNTHEVSSFIGSNDMYEQNGVLVIDAFPDRLIVFPGDDLVKVDFSPS